MDEGSIRIQVQVQVQVQALDAFISTSARDPAFRLQRRLYAVRLVTAGMPCAAVARLLDEEPRSVQRWVARFRRQGPQGLVDGARTGRPAQLATEHVTALREDLAQPPREFGYDRPRWDGTLLALHLRVRFQLDLGVRQCQRILRDVVGVRRDSVASPSASSSAAAPGPSRA